MSVASLSPGTIHRPRGQMIVTIAGVAYPMGSVDLSRNVTVTDADVYTNEFYNKTLIDSQIDELTCELTAVFHQVSLPALMFATLSDYHAVAQAASQANVVNFDLTGLTLPIVIPLEKRMTSAHVIADTGDTDLVEGVNYIVHPGQNGPSYVSFISLPEGADGVGTITFNAAKCKAVRFNIGEKGSVEAKVEYLESVRPGSDMSPMYHCYWRAQFRTDGDWTLSGDSADPSSISTKAKVVADTTKPVGQQLGYVETFVEAVAA